FSSRRRHTRCYRDWSSDVCSSDLAYSLPYALTCVPAAFFRTSKQDALVALRALPDASDLNRVLIETGQAAAAGRLAGALRASGQIGRASCRERGEIPGVDVTLKRK